jgi:RimJ/RimL family protein N-acetyltransferase
MPARIKLITDRLLIRTYQTEDAPDLNQFVRENTYYLYETAPLTLRSNLSLASSIEFLEMLERRRIDGKWIWNAIFKKESRQFIGQISIYNFEESTKTCELGYFITVDQMGNGYATEALRTISQYCFHELQRRSIMLRIKPDNIASKRVAEKGGFQYIGLQAKNFRTYHGAFIDQEVYELRK